MEMELCFLKVMDALRALSTEQARLTVINWAYEAVDQRPGPLSETGGRRPAPPLPNALYAVSHAGTLLRQRFLSEDSAREWALENYKGQQVFEIEQIVAS
jgi:hypothetical protein